jgi:hypothetical protein
MGPQTLLRQAELNKLEHSMTSLSGAGVHMCGCVDNGIGKKLSSGSRLATSMC